MSAPDDGAALIGLNEVCVVADVVGPDERADLIDWADRAMRAGELIANPADPGSLMTPYLSAAGDRTVLTGADARADQPLVFVPARDRRISRLPDAFWRVRVRMVERLGLGGLREDPYKGAFLNVVLPGGAVHPHVDARIGSEDETCDVLRCNVLFRRPPGGGMPMIGDETFAIAECGAWAFHPTGLRHSADRVDGGWRGTLSFGFLVRGRDRARRRYGLSRTIVDQFDLTDAVRRRAFAASIRGSAGAGALGGGRLALVDFAIGAGDGFTVGEAAIALGEAPLGVEQSLIDLQRAGFVESASGRQLPGMVRAL